MSIILIVRSNCKKRHSTLHSNHLSTDNKWGTQKCPGNIQVWNAAWHLVSLRRPRKLKAAPWLCSLSEKPTRNLLKIPRRHLPRLMFFFKQFFKPSIGFDISVPESGHYVIMVTYLHPERFTQRAFVRVGYERGHLEILPCKYQFACRQFAMDDNKKPKSFELTASPDKHELKLESSVSSKIAVVGIT